ncbi:hypothetical protein CBR_g12363 [Chara braunii]|uniref:Uncharacterized protein n=1 Tax=Chara braunii TaxID=69332 RepID=A0A388KRU5_CHABU|nr:hypothetical protein CBR_g12363 [Chara braunii]|eukprot:GBG72795.1 hypothetical protein CBR_g12363 [Chara braunii]
MSSLGQARPSWQNASDCVSAGLWAGATSAAPNILVAYSSILSRNSLTTRTIAAPTSIQSIADTLTYFSTVAKTQGLYISIVFASPQCLLLSLSAGLSSANEKILTKVHSVRNFNFYLTSSLVASGGGGGAGCLCIVQAALVLPPGCPCLSAAADDRLQPPLRPRCPYLEHGRLQCEDFYLSYSSAAAAPGPAACVLAVRLAAAKMPAAVPVAGVELVVVDNTAVVATASACVGGAVVVVSSAVGAAVDGTARVGFATECGTALRTLSVAWPVVAGAGGPVVLFGAALGFALGASIAAVAVGLAPAVPAVVAHFAMLDVAAQSAACVTAVGQEGALPIVVVGHPVVAAVGVIGERHRPTVVHQSCSGPREAPGTTVVVVVAVAATIGRWHPVAVYPPCFCLREPAVYGCDCSRGGGRTSGTAVGHGFVIGVPGGRSGSVAGACANAPCPTAAPPLPVEGVLDQGALVG